MPEVASMSPFFSGPLGALVMSMIAMSIVFLVIVGLMFVMVATHKLVVSFDKDKARKIETGAK